MLPIDRRRRVRVADVPARPVARPPAPVIPAPRVLRHVPAQRPLVPDLRRRHQFRRFHQQPEPLPHQGVLHHLGQCRQRPDFQPAVQVLDSPQLRHLAQVDHHVGAFRPILQPVERVEPARQNPGVRSVPFQQAQRVVHRGRLEQFERRHYVSNNCHSRCSSSPPEGGHYVPSIFATYSRYSPSTVRAPRGPLRAPSESCRPSPASA